MAGTFLWYEPYYYIVGHGFAFRGGSVLFISSFAGYTPMEVCGQNFTICTVKPMLAITSMK